MKKRAKTGPWSQERKNAWYKARYPEKVAEVEIVVEAPKTNGSDCEKAIPEVASLPSAPSSPEAVNE